MADAVQEYLAVGGCENFRVGARFSLGPLGAAAVNFNHDDTREIIRSPKTFAAFDGVREHPQIFIVVTFFLGPQYLELFLVLDSIRHSDIDRVLASNPG